MQSRSKLPSTYNSYLLGFLWGIWRSPRLFESLSPMIYAHCTELIELSDHNDKVIGCNYCQCLAKLNETTPL